MDGSLTVLLIDDCAEDRVIFRQFLQHDSLYTYSVLELETATQAIEWCQQEIPDVILLDFLLADGDGLVFLEQLRGQLGNTQSAVIMLTAQGDEIVAVRAMKSGAQDYLVKNTLTPEILQGAIRNAVEHMHLNRQLEQSREQQRLMGAIALRIRQSLQLEEILTATATEVRQFLQADRVIVYQFYPDMSGIIVAESVLPGWRVTLGTKIEDSCFQKVAGANYHQGKKKAIDNIYQAGLTDCYLQLLEQFAVKANLVVPILVSNQLWGLLIVHQCAAPRHWQGVELELLDQLGVQIAIAIQQASAYERLQAELKERQQTETSLRESEERFRCTFEQAAVGISHVSPSGEFIRFNQRFCEIAGYSQAELQTLNFQDITHPDDLAGDLEQMQKMLAGEIDTYSIEKRYIRKDGSIVWINLTVSLVRDRSGVAKYFIYVIQDITDRKQVEAALQQKKERLNMALEAAKMGKWDWNIQTGEIYWSDNLEQIFGMNPGTFNGRYETVVAMMHPDDRPSVLQAINRAVYEGEDYNIEFRFIKPDGTLRWALSKGRVFYDQKGNPLQMIGVDLDITERKQAEQTLQQLNWELEARVEQRTQALQTSEQLWQDLSSLEQAILDGSDYAIISTNFEGIIQTFSAGAEKMLGYTSDEVLFQVTPIIFHDLEEFQQRVAAFSLKLGREIPTPQEFFTLQTQDGNCYEEEWTHIRKDGSRLTVFLSMKALQNIAGESIGFLRIAKNITQQKQIEAQLCKNAATLTAAQRIANLGSWEFDLQTQDIIWSEEVFRIFGRDIASETPTYEELCQLIHPDDRDRHDFVVKQASQQGQSYEIESRFYRPDESLGYLLARCEVILDADGQPRVLIGTVQDITNRKQAEEQLRNLSDRLTLALKSGAIGTWDWDIIHDPCWDDRMYELYDLPRSDSLSPYQIWINALHPDDRVVAEAALQAAVRGEQDFDTEFRIIHRDGSIHFIKASGIVQRNEHGEAQRMVGINYDITERKQIESALRESEQRYATLAEASPVAIFRLDASGNCIYVNHRWCEMTGKSVQAALGMKWLDSLHLEDRDRIWIDWAEKFPQKPDDTRELYQIEGRHIRPDGTINYFYVQVVSEIDPSGSIIGYVGTLTDITERKQAEEALAKYASEIEDLYDHAPCGYHSLNAEGRFVNINQTALQWLGYTHEEIIGRHFTSIITPVSCSVFYQNYSQFQERGWVKDLEFDLVCKDGKIFPVLLSATAVKSANGTYLYSRSTLFDIRDRKQTEAQLRQTNEQLSHANAELARATRLKDEFLANMSHELRTPLNAILGMSEGFTEGVFGDINERQEKAIATIERSGKHLLELINDILDLSKIESGKLELQLSDVSVRSLCEASLSFVRQMAFKKNIHLSYQISDYLGTIQVDERRLRQVLINLLSNAIKFTPEAGSVSLQVSFAPSAPNICFCVADTGIGIADEDMKKLFQPFIQIDSSLNRQYEGTGLGLALVQRIAKLHQGTVSVSSEVGKGSCFTVHIPYHTSDIAPTTQATTPLPSHCLPRDNAQVLIIEDSIPAADQISRYLNEMGMQTIVYPSGEGAAKEVQRLSPALVILDLQLPNLSGWEVLNQIKANPKTTEVPIMIISVMDEYSTGLSQGAFEYLVKPITRNQLQATLKKLQYPQCSDARNLIVVPKPDPKSALIMLAEDNQANINTMSGYLESRGYRLVVAKNGQQAIDIALNQRPDLILMDIQMPIMDGLETIRCIRNHQQFVNVPIIALTALAMPGDRETCLKAGANEYFSKPVKLKQLAATIQQLLQR